MTIEEKLKEYIKERYGSLLQFVNQIDMSYSTFDSILRRGICNASISNILKICEELNISADALAKGKIQTVTPQYSNVGDINTQDVGEIIERTKKRLLAYDGLMFNGKPADQESINSILDAMEVGMELAKRKTKEK